MEDENGNSDNIINISNNKANNDGGGIYLLQNLAYYDTVGINIHHGNITHTEARKFGGGIYQTGDLGACIITGNGSVSDNIAANGGGIYIADGVSTSEKSIFTMQAERDTRVGLYGNRRRIMECTV